MTRPPNAPRGFRLKAKPAKADDANVLARLQDLFNRAGAEEHGTSEHPITHELTPIKRKVLVLVALDDGSGYPDIRLVIKAQHRLLGMGLDASQNRLEAESEVALVTE